MKSTGLIYRLFTLVVLVVLLFLCLSPPLLLGAGRPDLSPPAEAAGWVDAPGLEPRWQDTTPASPEETFTLSGRVTGNDGNPVSGVTISAYPGSVSGQVLILQVATAGKI